MMSCLFILRVSGKARFFLLSKIYGEEKIAKISIEICKLDDFFDLCANFFFHRIFICKQNGLVF